MIIFNGIGFLTAFIQKLLTARLIQNVELPYYRICLEFSIVVTSVIHYQITQRTDLDTMLSDGCSTIIELSAQDKTVIDTVYTYMTEKPDQLNFKQNFTCIVIQYTLILIIMLEKTQGIGELIMMILHMVD